MSLGDVDFILFILMMWIMKCASVPFHITWFVHCMFKRRFFFVTFTLQTQVFYFIFFIQPTFCLKLYKYTSEMSFYRFPEFGRTLQVKVHIALKSKPTQCQLHGYLCLIQSLFIETNQWSRWSLLVWNKNISLQNRYFSKNQRGSNNSSQISKQDKRYVFYHEYDYLHLTVLQYFLCNYSYNCFKMS